MGGCQHLLTYKAIDEKKDRLKSGLFSILWSGPESYSSRKANVYEGFRLFFFFEGTPRGTIEVNVA